MIDTRAVYVLWLREVKRYSRSPSRIVSTIAMPILLLIFLGLGFRQANFGGILPKSISYISFLVPGIIGMSLLSTSVFAGISVLWDREFGFLKEITVAPINNLSIVIGRAIGGSTTSMIQSIIVLIVAMVIGFSSENLIGFVTILIPMFLISIIFISLGLILAANMTDIQGFGMIMNLVVFPLFLLSGALFPIKALPSYIYVFSYLDPLTYGVDAMRGILCNLSAFPVVFDIFISSIFVIILLSAAVYFFNKSESK